MVLYIIYTTVIPKFSIHERNVLDHRGASLRNANPRNTLTTSGECVEGVTPNSHWSVSVAMRVGLV